MNLSLLESLTRSALNELSTTRLSQSCVYAALNDGYKDVASKAFCVEHVDELVTTPGDRFLRFDGHRINKVELISPSREAGYIFQDGDYIWTDGDYIWTDSVFTSAFNHHGMLPIMPEMLGYLPLSGTHPKYWFQWGQYLVIEPAPDNAYILHAYIADWPAKQMLTATDTPADLPDEFEESVVDFALWVLSIRLRKWGQAARFYNEYIQKLAYRRFAYLKRTVDKRDIRIIPEGATWQQ